MSATGSSGHGSSGPASSPCPGGLHDHQPPLSERRPVVVFCLRCQTAKTVTR